MIEANLHGLLPEDLEGHTLVFQLNVPVNPEELAQIKEDLEQALPKAKIVILTTDIDLVGNYS